MALTGDDLVEDGPNRRRIAVVAALAAALVAVIVIAVVASGGDDDGDASATSSSAPDTQASLATSIASVPASTSPTNPSSSTSGPTTTSAAPTTAVPSATTVAPATTATTAAPAGPTAPPTSLEVLPIPTGTIVRGDEVGACAEIKDRLATYRQLAEDNGPASVEQLQPQLEELELDIFTAADQQVWGDQIIEQLTNVRREWATALSANSSGDDVEAQARFDAAFDFLDNAIAVECPT